MLAAFYVKAFLLAAVALPAYQSYITTANTAKVNAHYEAAVDLVSIDETEPMGTIGLFFQYAFSPRWSVAARAGALGFDLGNIEGEIYAFEGRTGVYGIER